MNTTFRCKCPITSGLDILGDKWTLVIIKQMLFEEKSTFKDFIESQESIATNILSSRLKMLEKFGIIQRDNHPNNKKIKIYTLTEKGLSLTPLLIELTIWSNNNIKEIHPKLDITSDLEAVKNNREATYQRVIKSYHSFKESLLSFAL